MAMPATVTALAIAPVKGLSSSSAAASRSGRRDAPTLKRLAELRGRDDVTFGVWCEVVAPGRVRVGDPVA